MMSDFQIGKDLANIGNELNNMHDYIGVIAKTVNKNADINNQNAHSFVDTLNRHRKAGLATCAALACFWALFLIQDYRVNKVEERLDELERSAEKEKNRAEHAKKA